MDVKKFKVLTKEATLIETGWDVFAREAWPDANPYQASHLRQAFYAGAIHHHNIIAAMHIEDSISEKDVQAAIKSLACELTGFVQAEGTIEGVNE